MELKALGLFLTILDVFEAVLMCSNKTKTHFIGKNRSKLKKNVQRSGGLTVSQPELFSGPAGLFLHTKELRLTEVQDTHFKYVSEYPLEKHRRMSLIQHIYL